jgi:hypothetical protein
MAKELDNLNLKDFEKIILEFGITVSIGDLIGKGGQKQKGG